MSEWQFLDLYSVWTKFDANSSRTIEEAFKHGNAEVEIADGIINIVFASFMHVSRRFKTKTQPYFHVRRFVDSVMSNNWKYDSGNGVMAEMDEYVSQYLSDAVVAGYKSICYHASRQTYSVNFTTMTQKNVCNGTIRKLACPQTPSEEEAVDEYEMGEELEEDEPFIDNVFTSKLFQDPAIDSDGHTYEYKQLKAWVRKNKSSVINKTPMRVEQIVKNHTMKKAVEIYKIFRPILLANRAAAKGKAVAAGGRASYSKAAETEKKSMLQNMKEKSTSVIECDCEFCG